MANSMFIVHSKSYLDGNFLQNYLYLISLMHLFKNHHPSWEHSMNIANTACACNLFLFFLPLVQQYFWPFVEFSSHRPIRVSKIQNTQRHSKLLIWMGVKRSSMRWSHLRTTWWIRYCSNPVFLLFSTFVEQIDLNFTNYWYQFFWMQ